MVITNSETQLRPSGGTKKDPVQTLAITLVVIVCIVVGLILALPHLLDVNRYRGQVQAELQRRLNRPVQLGQLSLNVFPLTMKAFDVVIGDDPSYHSDVPFAQAAELDLSIKLFPLLRGKIAVESLEMKRPRIELICNAQGV